MSIDNLRRAATDACARYREAEAKELTAGGTYFSIPVEELDALREAIMRLEQALIDLG